MILADKIIYHRKKLGLTQEDLAGQLGVSRQSVSKWEGAQSIPDMDKIIQLSNVFSVSIDYLLRDELEDSEYLEERDNFATKRLNLERANSFMEANRLHSKRVALGVLLCILSPTLLILLNETHDRGLLKFSGDLIDALGLIPLILMVTLAVGIFIWSASLMKPYEDLKNLVFESDYGVEGVIRKKKEEEINQLSRKTALGVMLLISSLVPVLMSDLLFTLPFLQAIGVPILLLMVAAGVYLLVRSSILRSSYHILLQEEGYQPSKKKTAKKYDLVAGIYWLTAVTIYLASSFITGNWERTWIVWPVAGVFFGVVSLISSIFFDE